jgi:hypothetical protein
MVGLEFKKASRLVVLQHADGMIDNLTGLGIHLANELTAEVGIVDLAVKSDHVMRHGLEARQVVARDDHMRGAALRTREHLQRIFVGLVLRQIDGCEILRGLTHLRLIHDAAISARARQKLLWPLWLAARRVGAHARDDLHEVVGGKAAAQRTNQRMASRAVLQKRLLVIGARHGGQPFGACELRCDVVGLRQLYIAGGGLARSDIGRGALGRVVAGRANLDRVVAGLQPVGREGVVPLLVGYDGRRDVGAILLCGDQHAFHGAFLRRSDGPREGLRRSSRHVDQRGRRNGG